MFFVFFAINETSHWLTILQIVVPEYADAARGLENFADGIGNLRSVNYVGIVTQYRF